MGNLKRINQIILLAFLSLNLESCNIFAATSKHAVYAPRSSINNDNLMFFYESSEEIKENSYYIKMSFITKNEKINELKFIDPDYSIYSIKENNNEIFLCDYIKINDDEFNMANELNYKIEKYVCYRLDIQITIKESYSDIFEIYFKGLNDYSFREQFCMIDFFK